VSVVVFEAESRPGGKVWSDRVDGFLCERGPNGFLDNRPKTLELCRELGLEPLRSNDNAKRRFIFSNGKLNEISASPLAFFKSDLISWKGKMRLVYELFAPKGPDDESVSDFVIRRLGREGLEKLIDPMSSGIFAGDPYKMSIRHCFPRIKELEQQYGSLIKAMFKLKKERKKSGGEAVGPAPGGNLTSFYQGAQVLTDTLSERIKETLKLGISVKGLEKARDVFKIYTTKGDFSADTVILASPAHVSAKILRSLDAQLSRVLFEIPYAPVSVVCFGYKRDKVEHSLRGFGFLVPHREGKSILGTLWDSSVFPNRAQEGLILLRSMVGGAQSPEKAMLDDSALTRTVFDDLKPIVSLKADPEMVRIYRWEEAIPQYEIGHGEKLLKIDERLISHPGLYITGNAYRGIGINDCIENSYKLVDNIMLKSKPAS
jgi:oxygen-dependent protoporphyrinogen oxidase